MNRLIKKTLPAFGALGLLASLWSSDVSARGIDAGAGYPEIASNTNCFDKVNGSFATHVVENHCSSTQFFDISLPFDNGGSKSLTFAGASVTCQAFASDEFAGSVSSSPPVTLGLAMSNASTAAITVPGGGRFWLRCSVPFGGLITNVNYPQ